MNSEKDTFLAIYSVKFKKKLNSLNDKQSEKLFKLITSLNPNIPHSICDGYYIFNTKDFTLEEIKKVWEILSHL